MKNVHTVKLRDDVKSDKVELLNTTWCTEQAHKHGIGALVHSNRLKHAILLNVWAFMNEEEHLPFMSVLMCHQSVDTPCCQTHAATATCVSQLGQWKQPVQMYEMTV